MSTSVMSRTPAAAVPVDHRQLQVNQAAIVALVVIGFVAGNGVGAVLTAVTGLSLATGALRPGSGPFQVLYRRVLRPAGLRPDVHTGDPAPHRFAALMGSGVLLVAALLLGLGADISGWGLVFIVVALALVNLLFGFCAGCFLYLQLGRLRAHEGMS